MTVTLLPVEQDHLLPNLFVVKVEHAHRLLRRVYQNHGANGARVQLSPQKDWAVNDPAQLAKVLQSLKAIQKEFNSAQAGGKMVSLADMIVLGGCASIEKAAKNAGYNLTVPFTAGRTDASQAQTDVESFAVLQPAADGFRNYLKTKYTVTAEEMLVDKAQLLTDRKSTRLNSSHG